MLLPSRQTAYPLLFHSYSSLKTHENAKFKEKQLPKFSAESDFGGVKGLPTVFVKSS